MMVRYPRAEDLAVDSRREQNEPRTAEVIFSDQIAY